MSLFVHKVMSSPAVTVTYDCTVEEVASLMVQKGIGFLPVMRDGQLVGSVTDRDLVLKVLSRLGTLSGWTAGDVMCGRLLTCHVGHRVEEAAAIMGDYQVRRLPVLDRDGALVGVLTVGDIAADVSERLAGETLGEIVEDR